MQPAHQLGSKCRRHFIAAALGIEAPGGVAAVQIVAAQSPRQPPAAAGPAVTVAPSRVDLVPMPFELKALPADPTELCEDKPGGRAWLDRMQAGLYRTTCLSAAR